MEADCSCPLLPSSVCPANELRKCNPLEFKMPAPVPLLLRISFFNKEMTYSSFFSSFPSRNPTALCWGELGPLVCPPSPFPQQSWGSDGGVGSWQGQEVLAEFLETHRTGPGVTAESTGLVVAADGV